MQKQTYTYKRMIHTQRPNEKTVGEIWLLIVSLVTRTGDPFLIQGLDYQTLTTSFYTLSLPGLPRPLLSQTAAAPPPINVIHHFSARSRYYTPFPPQTWWVGGGQCREIKLARGRSILSTNDSLFFKMCLSFLLKRILWGWFENVYLFCLIKI